MHFDLLLSNEPDPDAQFGVPPEQITAELRQFLTEHGHHHGGLGWFLDALGFTTTLNRTALDNNVHQLISGWAVL